MDINTDQQSLIWRPHLLTEAMKTRRADDLMLEPVLNPGGAVAARVKIETNQLLLRWDWGNWKQVDISAKLPDGQTVVRSFVVPQPAEVRWQDLPIVSEIELTFHSEDGTTATAMVQVPALTNVGIDVEISPKINNRVRVQLLRSMAPAHVEVELLRLGQEDKFKLSGRPFRFSSEQRQMELFIPTGFNFNIIAVIAKREARQWLLAAADCHDDGEVVPQEILNEKLLTFIASRNHNHVVAPPRLPNIEEWLRSWPSNSQRRLTALYDRLRQYFSERQLNDTDELLRMYPTGLLRYLTLIESGLNAANPTPLIQQLNGNNFQKGLNSALPELGAAIAALRNPDERIWAIQNANNRNLPAAVSEAKNDGLPALRRALHLADKRSEAIASWESRRPSLASAGSKQVVP